jgi:dihydroneopterin aldolase
MSNHSNCSITLKKLKLSLKIGISEEEKSCKQEIYITIQLFLNQLPNGCITDNIDDTLCYAELVGKLTKSFASKRYNLIEKLANDIADFILQSSKGNFIAAVNVEVEKHPNLPIDNQGVIFKLCKSCT